jgi:hypothetical protein
MSIEVPIEKDLVEQPAAPMLTELLSKTFPQANLGEIALQAVEIYRDGVVIRWQSSGGATLDDGTYREKMRRALLGEIELSDDTGKRYTLLASGGFAINTVSIRGEAAYSPGLAASATEFTVTFDGKSCRVAVPS